MTGLEVTGDVPFVNDQLAGSQGQRRAIHGFELDFDPAVPDLCMAYLARCRDAGNSASTDAGTFVGSRGADELQGFSIKLTGAAAADFTIRYLAHIDTRDTDFVRDGAFCGMQGHRVEGIFVHVEKLV
jgi:hypothetical protein